MRGSRCSEERPRVETWGERQIIIFTESGHGLRLPYLPRGLQTPHFLVHAQGGTSARLPDQKLETGFDGYGRKGD
jgi:hypothetical protein